MGLEVKTKISTVSLEEVKIALRVGSNTVYWGGCTKMCPLWTHFGSIWTHYKFALTDVKDESRNLAIFIKIFLQIFVCDLY